MLLRPSNAHRWWHCGLAAYATSTDGTLPDDETEAAREGTCAAWVAEVVINGDAHSTEDMLGKTHKNGWVVDEDMVRFTQDYVDLVQGRPQFKAEDWITTEIGANTLAGTMDAWSATEDWSEMWIDDLKYGYGIVDAFENRQLLCYAFLIVKELRATGRPVPETFHLSIYQPRAVHPDGIYRTWTISRENLWRYFEDLSQRVQNIDRSATPGKHCQNCTAAATCNALTSTIYDMWEVTQARDITIPTGQQLADELDMLERMSAMLKARYEAVKTEAEIRIKSQKFVPGWSLVRKVGKRAWKVKPEMVHLMTGVDPYDRVVVTPAELERRKADKTIIAELTHKPEVGFKLDRVSERDIAALFDKESHNG